MKRIIFAKMVASGNDFIVAELRAKNQELRKIAKQVCDRKYGVGADGLLVLEKSRKADVRMRVFNVDGSEAEMCGNGARCAALYMRIKKIKARIKIETLAGVVDSEVKSNKVRIKLTDPKNLKESLPVNVGKRKIEVNYINTGVPHVVVFVEGLDKIDIVALGRYLRFHRKFVPKGANVNFVEVLDRGSIKIRTYERGVEDETLACGTGSVAAAVITSLKLGKSDAQAVKVLTKSKEVLNIYFTRVNHNKISDVWLEGEARVICKGDYYV